MMALGGGEYDVQLDGRAVTQWLKGVSAKSLGLECVIPDGLNGRRDPTEMGSSKQYHITFRSNTLFVIILIVTTFRVPAERPNQPKLFN